MSTAEKPTTNESTVSIQTRYNEASKAHAENDLESAKAGYCEILEHMPNHPQSLHYLGIIMLQQGDQNGAIEKLKQALASDPNYAAAHFNLGMVLIDAQNFQQAHNHFTQAEKTKDFTHQAQFQQAVCLQKLQHHADAATIYEALLKEQDLEDIQTNLGACYVAQGNINKATKLYEKVITNNPSSHIAHNNLGLLYKTQRKHLQAIEHFRKALALMPDYLDAAINLAALLQEQEAREEAATILKSTLSHNPKSLRAQAAFSHLQQHLCDWETLEKNQQSVRDAVMQKQEVIPPFSFICMPSTSEEQLICARTWAEQRLNIPSLYSEKSHRKRRKSARTGPLRIGYISSDFHTHATAFLMAGMLEQHDPKKVSAFTYALNPPEKSETYERLKKGCKQFRDVSEMAAPDIAKRIFDDQIDILVDLKGYTQGARTSILAYRPAPIQLQYLGYPGTMGLEAIDYMFADPTVAPMERQPHYSEKLVHIASCYQVNDDTREIATPQSRSAYGLPETGEVLAAFHLSYKITPQMFSSWIQILKAKDKSVLWLLDTNDTAKEHLRQATAKEGVDTNRLIFAPKLPLDEHLARYQMADLALDTFPVNGHTTTSDALWAGCPVVTIKGETFISRVAASLLHSVGLQENICTDITSYQTRIRDILENENSIASLKETLKHHKAGSILFDTKRMTAQIEKVYQHIWEHWQQEKPAEAFSMIEEQ